MKREYLFIKAGKAEAVFEWLKMLADYQSEHKDCIDDDWWALRVHLMALNGGCYPGKEEK